LRPNSRECTGVSVTSRPVHWDIRPVLRNCTQSGRDSEENSSNIGKQDATWALEAPVPGWGERVRWIASLRLVAVSPPQVAYCLGAAFTQRHFEKVSMQRGATRQGRAQKTCSRAEWIFLAIVEPSNSRENTAGLQSRACPYAGTLAQICGMAFRRSKARDGGARAASCSSRSPCT
jgi:hypothetical protein